MHVLVHGKFWNLSWRVIASNLRKTSDDPGTLKTTVTNSGNL